MWINGLPTTFFQGFFTKLIVSIFFNCISFHSQIDYTVFFQSFFSVLQFLRLFRGTANELDERIRARGHAASMIEVPLEREASQKDVYVENEELKVRLIVNWELKIFFWICTVTLCLRSLYYKIQNHMISDLIYDL